MTLYLLLLCLTPWPFLQASKLQFFLKKSEIRHRLVCLRRLYLLGKNKENKKSYKQGEWQDFPELKDRQRTSLKKLPVSNVYHSSVIETIIPTVVISCKFSCSFQQTVHSIGSWKPCRMSHEQTSVPQLECNFGFLFCR